MAVGNAENCLRSRQGLQLFGLLQVSFQEHQELGGFRVFLGRASIAINHDVTGQEGQHFARCDLLAYRRHAQKRPERTGNGHL